MKHILITILHLSCYLLVAGQDKEDRTFFQTNSKTHLYYVDLGKSDARIYQMGGYLDKAGTGYSIRNTDTLTRQLDSSFSGRNTKITIESDKLFLITQYKKTKKIQLDPVKNLNAANNNLNNAYYLDHYFKMSDELNKSYLLNHHSFRNGYYTWKELQNKEINHLQFREFADRRIKEIKDSVANIQDKHVELTNYIIQNITSLDYNTLTENLKKLPAEYRYLSWYFGTVINEIARQAPEFFFKLAEDFPDKRSLIFIAVEKDKQVIQRLRAVEGHDEIKKAFFKK